MTATQSISEILDLERIEDDIYRSGVIHSELDRTFGGQVAAQALVAATRTVDDSKFVHSLHGYFIRPGVSRQDTVYMVNRMRDGNSFATRHVEAVQNGETIFSMQASFHRRGDEGIEHSDHMRDVPHPDEIKDSRETLPPSSRALLNEWSDWDLRIVPPDQYEHNKYTPSQQVVWFRSRQQLPDDDTFHVCTLAYMSDMTLLHSSMVPHPGHKV